jgi:peptidoglycan/LPS O-acetylase OafA/YrhL
MSMKRLGNIDALRGFCALLVVLQHLSLPSWLLGGSLWRSHPHFYLDTGRVGVAAFFLISGYVIPFSVSREDKPVTRFWISRFFRLWPLYWLSIALALWTGASLAPLTFKTVASNVTMLQRFVGIPDILGVFWTLQIELIFYFIITIMIVAGVVGRRDYFRKMFYVMVMTSLVLSVARGYSHVKLPVALPMAMTLMFLAGYIRHCKLVSASFPRIEIIVYLITLIPVCLMGYGAGVDVHDDPYRWMLAYSLGLFLFLAFESVADAPQFFVFLGSISYSIYLLHEVVIKALQTILGDGRHLLVGCLSILGVVLVSWASYKFVERPFQRLGRHLSSRLASASTASQAINIATREALPVGEGNVGL